MTSPGIYDIIVIGLGGHGSAALMHAARGSARVLGLERFDIGHAMGSSHGVHRLFRLAYAEGRQYVPLLKRARDLWLQLGEDAGEAIFVETGVLIGGPADRRNVAASRATCEAEGIAHEMLDHAEIHKRYPAFRLPEDFVGLMQAQSGFVYSERAIAAHIMQAMLAGARIETRSEVMAIEPDGAGVAVITPHGRHLASQVIVTAGAWTHKLVPDLARMSTVGRRALGFFAPRRPADFTLGRCPSFSFHDGRIGIYGFPIAGFPGVKIGRDGHLGETGEPDELRREGDARDEAALREGIDAFLRDCDGPALALKGCVLTETTDHNFIIDRHPAMPQVQVISACSGHGFKMASAIGEIAARRALGHADTLDLASFRLARFGRAA